MKVFLAHSIHDSEDSIVEMQRIITMLFRDYADADVEVVPGRDDFKENFASAGGWRGWPVDVVTRCDYMTREPIYAAIVVPAQCVGKATAQIIETALDKNRPVLYLHNGYDDAHDMTLDLMHVVALDCEDSQNAKSGWCIRTGGSVIDTQSP